MTAVRKRPFAAAAWAMIPLAAWAGMPSTACVCSNGRVKLFCEYLLACKRPAPSACASDCCAQKAANEDTDCCSGCSRGGKSDTPGIASKSCCNPILTSPSASPRKISAPCDHFPAGVDTTEQVGALVRPTFIPVAIEFNTGPPLDRVVVFRSLLI